MRPIQLNGANILSVCCEVLVGGGSEHSSREGHNLYNIYKIDDLKTNQLLQGTPVPGRESRANHEEKN